MGSTNLHEKLSTYQMVKSLKNILILPSWYPTEAMPLFGSFVMEQAHALANNRAELRVIVSLRADPDAKLSYKKPFEMMQYFIRGTFSKVDRKTISPNLVELRYPAFSFKHILHIQSAIDRLYALSEQNLKYAIQQFGKISLMHVHVAYPAGYVAALLSKKYGIPYIITEHMSPFPFESLVKNGKLDVKLKYAFEHASGSIAVGNSLADAVASFGLPRPVVIPNMVDGSNFKINTNADLNFAFLTVGGLNKQKGISDLLDAIHIWSPESGSIKFRIAGKGPLEDALKSKSKKLGIEKYIEWLGVVSRDKIPALFNNCNCFVLPSYHETFGIVYAEALASGKTVIATRCGGPEDIVNKANGMLIEKGNPAELAKAMEWMYNNWASFNPIDIRNDFDKRFSQKVVSGSIANFYNHVILNPK